MFKTKEMFFAAQKNHKSGRLVSILLALQICLMVLLVPGSVFATEPVDLDPDPDLTSSITTIIVNSLDEVDVDSLEPGTYVIIVIHEDGSQDTYTIRVTD